MGQVNYRGLGDYGLNTDVDPAELPVGILTDMVNALPDKNGIINATGFTPSGLNVGQVPTFLLYEKNKGVHKVHSFAGGSIFTSWGDSPIDSSPEVELALNPTWSAINHKEVVYACNGIDQLLYYDENYEIFKEVPGVPSNIQFQIVRTYKDFLMCLGVFTDSSLDDERIYWSHPAEIGKTPASWDVADPAYDAGFTSLPTNRGQIVDARELGDRFIIYKNNSIWAMDYVGGNSIFRQKKLYDGYGLLIPGLVVNFEGGHFFVSENSFYVFTGSAAPVDVGRHRVAKKFFESLDEDTYRNSFITVKESKKEIWLHYPSTGTTFCNQALVWNWELDSWGFAETPEISYAFVGENVPKYTPGEWLDEGTEVWSTDAIEWIPPWSPKYEETCFSFLVNEDNGTFEMFRDKPALGITLQSGEEVTQRFLLERKDFLLGPFSARGNVIQTYETIKIISEIWIRAVTDAPLLITLGGRDNESHEMDWDTPEDFDPNIDSKLDTFNSFRFQGMVIENDTATVIKIQGFNIRWEDGGDF